MIFAMSVPVFADMTPKPKLEIIFSGFPKDESEAYVTLLLNMKGSIGGYHPWNGRNDGETASNPPEGHEKAWERFRAYEDADGYRFFQFSRLVSAIDASYVWQYYDPGTFKVAVYLPESERLLVSGQAEELYGMHSVFKVDLSGISDSDYADGVFVMTKVSSLPQEMLAFIARLVMTLIVEVGIAWLFRMKKEDVLIVVAVNICTQILLNLFLCMVSPHTKPMFFSAGIIGMIGFVPAEFVIIIIEAAAYVLLLGKKRGNGRMVGYAATANFVSFVIGLLLAGIMPFVF
jgi:hypothetical protein